MVVIIAIVVVLLIVLGGPESGAEVTTAAPPPSGESIGAATGLSAGAKAGARGTGSAMLIIEEGDRVPSLVVLYARAEGGVAMGVLGTTLMQTTDGFKTAAELHASNDDEALAAGIADILETDVGAVASVEWKTLHGALTGSLAAPEAPQSWPESLGVDEDAAGKATKAVLTLVGAAGSSEGAAAWEAIALGGESSAFREFVAQIAQSMSSSSWVEAVLPGKPVEGLGFEYFEPDGARAKTLLSGASGGEHITLEVQNGSGIVGIAEAAGALLESVGYRSMLPYRNADDFPDVEKTRISAAPDAVAEAQTVRTVLGVGQVIEDEALSAGHILVVVGKDFVPTTSADTEPLG